MAATFPSAPEGTSLRTVGDGVIEASSPDGGNTLWYNSAYYQEPDAPHSVMQSSNGVDWYAIPCWTSASVRVSIEDVASSKTITGGSATAARAMEINCRCP